MSRHQAPPTGRALLLAELDRNRPALLRVLGWSVVEALPALLSGLLIAAAADRGFLAGRPLVGCAWLGGLGVALAARAYAARAVFPQLAEVVEPLRDALVERVVRGALADPDPDGPAEVARLTEQVESARQLTGTLLRTLHGVGTGLLAALLGLALLAPPVLPLVLLPLLAGGALFGRLLGPLAQRRRALLLADERVAAESGRAFAALRDITAGGAQPRVGAELDEAFGAQAAAVRSLGRAAALRSLAVALGGRAPVPAVLLAAPWLLREHWLSVGQLLGVAAYLVQQLEPAARTLAGLVGGWLLELSVVMDRLAATGAPRPAPAPGPGPVPGAVAGGGIRITGLRHAHGSTAQPVLDGLDLDLGPDEHLAVVGPSGAGKSTLAALLAGLLVPDAGEVRIGGLRPHEPAAPDRARLLALVPQQAYLFPGTVRANLTWLDPEAGPAALDRAVRLLGAGPLVARLGGPDAELADPAALSAGERQLLALVRTYLSPAAVVVLDEATCHLDAAAEAVVERAFAARPGALVVVAHRIASAIRADRVLLLDSGRALTARHGDLQVLSPLYRELVGHWLGTAPPAARPPVARAGPDRAGPRAGR
ncbi:ABC transporter ATP-binding protein [Kitasatospora sp. NPDC094015]|uniref:ABC transporter ATP-binding protein n=1 Tax=Kitasatospora sp. NPDC094015 TaxID=3155205 RepID=UPI003326300D